MTPMEAIVAATQLGGADHDARRASSARSRKASSPTCCWSTAIRWPTSRMLQDQAKLLAIMKDGEFHKEPEMPLDPRRAGLLAA